MAADVAAWAAIVGMAATAWRLCAPVCRTWSGPRWAALAALALALTAFRGAALPLEEYRAQGHDLGTALRLGLTARERAPHARGDGRLIGAPGGRVYHQALGALETVLGGGRRSRFRERFQAMRRADASARPGRAAVAEAVEVRRFVRFPSLADVLLPVLLIVLTAVGMRLGAGFGAAAVAAAAAAAHPSALFLSSILADPWTAALAAAVVGFGLAFEAAGPGPFTARRGILWGAAAAGVFLTRYPYVLAALPFAAALALRADRRGLARAAGAGAAVFFLLIAPELPRFTALAQAVARVGSMSTLDAGVAPLSLSNLWHQWSARLLADSIRPTFAPACAAVLALGVWAAWRRDRRSGAALIALPAAFTLLPFAYQHPGERMWLVVVFLAAPFVALGLDRLAAAGVLAAAWVWSAGSAAASAPAGMFRIAPDALPHLAGAPVLARAEMARRLEAALGSERRVLALADDGREAALPWPPGTKLDVLTLPPAVAYVRARSGPVFLVLESDAFTRTSRFRLEYLRTLRAHFVLDPVGILDDGGPAEVVYRVARTR